MIDIPEPNPRTHAEFVGFPGFGKTQRQQLFITAPPMLAKVSTLSLLLLLVMAVVPNCCEAAESFPILRLRPDGPMSPVHRLEFSANSKALLAAGSDKHVMVWKATQDGFVRDHSASLRQPIGPADSGEIRAMGISGDNKDIVVGGIGAFSDRASFRENGIMYDVTLGEKTLGELGTVNVINQVTRETKSIVSHRGYIIDAAIVNDCNNYDKLLVTLGTDEDAKDVKVSLKVFDFADSKLLQTWSLDPTESLRRRMVAKSCLRNGKRVVKIAVASASGTAGGVSIFELGRSKPTLIDEPLAFGLCDIPGTDLVFVSSKSSVSVVDIAVGKLSSKQDLGDVLTPRDYISAVSSSQNANLVSVVFFDAFESPFKGYKLTLWKRSTKEFSQPIALGSGQSPAVAVSPSGRYVCATADVTKGLQIFDLNTFQFAAPSPSQIIASEFELIRGAELVGERADAKIRFQFERGMRESYELDSQRGLIPTSRPPKSFGSELTFRFDSQTGKFVGSVALAGKTYSIDGIQSASLPVGRAIASTPLGGVPIAAISTMKPGSENRPNLQLFLLKEGIPIRTLNGHDQIVSRLSFASDGSRLISISGDGLVCVWNLNDLDKIVNVRGSLPGIRLRKEQAVLTIDRVNKDIAVGSLQENDQILGRVTESGELQTFPSAVRLMYALSNEPVGSTPVLRIRRNGLQMDASVKLGQGIDERKPLVSFVVQRNPINDKLSWLAWTPHGPFTSSSEEIESKAGWHFNPIDARDTAKFVPLSEYREEFFGESLLEELLAHSKVPVQWPPAETPTLYLSLMTDDGKIVSEEGRSLTLNRTASEIRMLVENATARKLEAITATIGNAAPIQLQPSAKDPGIWKAPIDLKIAAEKSTQLKINISGSRLAGGEFSDAWVLYGASKPQPIVPAATPKPEPLPGLKITSHNKFNRVEASETGFTPDDTIRVVASVAGKGIPADVAVEYLLDGAPFQPNIKAVQANRIEFGVTPEIGLKTVGVRLRSKDGRQSDNASVSFYFYDPPAVLNASGLATDSARGRITGTVRSSSDLSSENVQVLVERFAGLPLKVQLDRSSTTKDEYRLTVQDIPLVIGRDSSSIELLVLDADRNSRPPFELVIQHPKKKQVVLDAPEIQWSLVDTSSVSAEKTGLDFLVTSDALESVELSVNHKRIPLKIPERKQGIGYAFNVEEVPLDIGTNQVQIVASQSDGQTALEAREISRIEPPTTVTPLRIALNNGNAIGVTRQANGSFVVNGPVPESAVTIEGRVALSLFPNDLSEDNHVVRVWVNGFLQGHANLAKSSDSNSYEFQIPVSLPSSKNSVLLDIPGRPEAEDSVVNFEIECDSPSGQQTLHLIVVTTEADNVDQTTIGQAALSAFRIRDGQSTAFSEVISGAPQYPVCNDYVDVRQIDARLSACRNLIERSKSLNHVVMFYFQGVEWRNKAGQFALITDDIQPDEDPFNQYILLTGDKLGSRFKAIPGAHVLLLDVALKGDVTGKKFASALPELGVLRLKNARPQSNAGQPLFDQLRKYIPQVETLIDLAGKFRTGLVNTESLAFEENIPPPIQDLRISGGQGR